MINPPLTDVEVRVLGSLVEKEATTPDNYPLSLSALVAACNQTTNRDPVMRLEEPEVNEAMVSLRRRSLLRAMQPIGSRVTKYSHLLTDALALDERELAVLGVLLLRGAQTAGELHARTTRLASFADIAAVEATLEALASREAGPLVTRLQRRAGQKEARYSHLLSGEPAPVEAPADALGGADAPVAAAPAGARARGGDARVEELERSVAELRDELAALRTQFTEFRAQFQ